MDSNNLNKALETLGSYLTDKGLKYELAAIGGGALLLLGRIIRPTKAAIWCQTQDVSEEFARDLAEALYDLEGKNG